jgi:glycyl-tRNA synthetase
MREVARRVGEAYLEQRKELEYPLLKESGEQRLETRESDAKPQTHTVTSPHAQRLVLEIGTEELPAADVDTALAQLRERVPSLLEELSLEHGPVKVEGTPRRLVVLIEALGPNQPDREDLIKGPPADKAFDKDGIALPAAMGFARKNNVNTRDLVLREQGGGKYVYAVLKQKGRPTIEVLAEALPRLVEGIKFEKSMRWLPASRRAGNDSGVAFSRPIRWLVALLGDQVIPFEYAGVTSGNTTRGLRPYDSPEIVIPSAENYLDAIREAGILLDREERKASIAEQVEQAASLVGGQAIVEQGLLNEVTNLVEMPTAVMGGFDREYLSLPREVLISVMRKHQRYFPVSSLQSSNLVPHFIAIRNGDDIGIDLVRQGNEHVLGARFADANFFVREDLKQPLEAYRPGLSKLIFQTRLGSMLDKSDRMNRLVNDLIPMLGLENDEAIFARRAVYLAKADLVTQMVMEMTSLQGIIGGEYARRSGEQKEVADAIGEQYQTVPKSRIGLAVALADRIDSLAGLFAAGLAPTGAKDPFGLRRAAIGVVQPLIVPSLGVEHGISLDLREALQKAARLQPIEVTDEVQKQILEFITGRLRVALNELGYRYDVVDAVLAEQSANPAAAAEAVKQLQRWVEREDWETILPGYARCVRIIRSASVNVGQLPAVAESLFVEPEEKKLHKAIEKNVKIRPVSVDESLNIVVKLIPPINAFFDKVLVMAENEKVKQNRLALVGQIARLSRGIADLSRLEGF